MENRLIPQNNTKEKDHRIDYMNLQHQRGVLRFNFLYEEKATKYGAFGDHEEKLQDYKISIGAKLMCKSCNNFNQLSTIVSRLREPVLCDLYYSSRNRSPQNLWRTCLCGYDAKALSIAITNMGTAATFCMNLRVMEETEEYGSSLLNDTKYLENNEKYQTEWSMESIDNTKINSYFSTSGDIAIICDISIQQTKNEIKIDNSIRPSQKLAAQSTPPDNLFTGIMVKNWKRGFLEKWLSKEDNAREFCKKYPDISCLRSFCVQELSRSVTFDNVKELWQAGIFLDNDLLVNIATVFMAKNWKMLSKEDDVRELCKKYPDLLFTISTIQADVLENYIQ